MYHTFAPPLMHYGVVCLVIGCFKCRLVLYTVIAALADTFIKFNIT